MRSRRAVFLHQLGELRNRVAETMVYRASGGRRGERFTGWSGRG